MASTYIVSSGVTSSGITLSAGDLMEVSGTAIGTIDGGEVEVFAGGVASATTVGSGGVLLAGTGTE